MNITPAELLQKLQLPADRQIGFEKNFEKSLATFRGVPDFLTMPFVERFYPWTEGDARHLPLFAEVAKRAANDPFLQLYAHHAGNALYVYEDEVNYGAWTPLEAYLGRDLCGIFDFMTATGAIPLWCETHRKLGIPEKYSRASAQWLKGTMQIYNSAHPGRYGISRCQSYWLKWNILGKLFRVGRFEYMADDYAPDWSPAVFRHRTTREVLALCGDNWGLRPDGSREFLHADEAEQPFHTKLTRRENSVTGTPILPNGVAEPGREVTLELDRWEEVFRPGDLVPGMHIPGGGNMNLEAARASWREALEFFPKYLKREVRGIICSSWIFNTAFERELPNSNLAKLMREVYLFPQPSFGNGRDGAFFIFGCPDGDFLKQPADNSVRRAFHKIVGSGELLKQGGMFVLPEEIAAENCSVYRKSKGL